MRACVAPWHAERRSTKQRIPSWTHACGDSQVPVLQGAATSAPAHPLLPPLRLCRHRHASKSATVVRAALLGPGESAAVMRAALLGPGECDACAPARGRTRAAGARGSQTRRRPAGRRAPAGSTRTGGGATRRRRTRRSRWRPPAAAYAAGSVSRGQYEASTGVRQRNTAAFCSRSGRPCRMYYAVYRMNTPANIV